MQAVMPKHPAPANGVHAGDVKAFMRLLGVKKWAAMPEDQYRTWQEPDQPLILRLWSLMCAMTIAIGHWTPYASSSDGMALTIEQMATLLEADEGNVRRAWREGVERGLWRNGTKQEGPRRLYLNGRVARVASSEGEQKGNEKVCTDLLPPYIRKQLKDWPEDRVREFLQLHTNEDEIEKLAIADAVAAVRAETITRKDTLYERFCLHKVREEHRDPVLNRLAPKSWSEAEQMGNSDEPAREARHAELAHRAVRREALATGIQKLVQTVSDFVQTRNSCCTNPDGRSAQSATTLSPSDCLKTPKTERASGQPVGSRKALQPRQDHDGRECKEVHRQQRPVSGTSDSKTQQELPELDEEGRKAEALLFSEIRNMQKAYPHTDFSAEKISSDRVTDRVFVRRILTTIGAGQALPFLLEVAAKFKGLGRRNSLAKLPARSPEDPHGPRSLGLIVEWAEDFARKQGGGR